MSIRLRLTLWYSGILAVTMLLFGLGLYFFLSYKMYNDIKNDLVLQAREVNDLTRSVGYRIMLPDQTFRSTGFYLQSYSLEGQVSRSTNLGQVVLPYDQRLLDAALNGQPSFQTVDLNGNALLIYYAPLVIKGSTAGVLQVAAHVDGYIAFFRTFRVVLFVFALLTVLLAASGGWFLSRKSLKPIENVIAAADRIQKSDDLDRRIEYAGPMDEIGRLTNTINGMLERIGVMYSGLEDAYRAQRRFVSDASHELRTPLTTIRGNVELLQKVWGGARKGEAAAGMAAAGFSTDGQGVAPSDSAEGGVRADRHIGLSLEALHDISSEAERMSRLVNDMLSLARADAGYTMTKERVEIKPLIEEVVRRAQFLPRTAEWTIGDTSVLEGAAVEGSKDYLQQLLIIFIENGFKYTEQGEVRLEFLRIGGQIGLKFSDTGIGMSKDEIPHIFERFYRADVSRGKTAGTGLGLSIAKWIIDQHDGSVEVLTRRGEGTTFLVWLPEAKLRSLPSSDEVGYNETTGPISPRIPDPAGE